jgi:hypothetical protein
MAEINDLTIVDASNTARFPELQAPSTVNNGARALEGIVARFHRDINTSVTTGGSSTVYTYAANQTLSAYYDGMMLGVDFHTACGATPTINVDAIGAKSLKWPNGTALAANDVATGQKAILVYDGTDMIVLTAGGNAAAYDYVDEDDMSSDSATKLPTQQSVKAYVDAATTVSRGSIDGLILSNDGTDPAKDIGISAGDAADDGQAVTMVLSSALIKKLDAAWAVGTNQGALDGSESVGGTPDASTWYHIWLIRRSDTGVVDILASESATAPTMPTNYDQKRRIGAVLFDATPDVLGFTQYGDKFYWDDRVRNVTGTPGVTTAILFTASAPLGVVTECLTSSAMVLAANVYYVINGPEEADAVADATNFDLRTTSTNGGPVQTNAARFTDTSSQLRYRSSSTSAAIDILTLGWIDPRGRNA